MRKIILSAVFFLSLSAFAGCEKAPPPLIRRTQADEKFLKISKEDFGLEPKINPLSKTLWIYLSISEPLFDLKANPAAMPGEAPKPMRGFTVQFFEGNYKDGTFYFDYDIIASVKVPKNPGYNNTYSEKFTTVQNNLLTAVIRSYLDIENTAQVPEFIVLIVADIVRGIEIKMIINIADFKRFYEQSMPPDEYLKRYLIDAKGDQAIIGDTTGGHLRYEEVQWTEFITKQIEKRVQYKYQESDFGPGEDTENEILKIIAETTKAYNFTDFSHIKLQDVREEKEYLFDRSQLLSFTE